MPPTTTHRTKRAFLPSNQSSLDTFLQRAPSSQPDREDLRSPPLPSSIQSNLLTVGMRIRKSVPEGYKTHKLGFHSISSAEIRLDETATAEGSGTRARELQPFCGLLKVGGYAAQEGSSGSGGYTPMPTSAFAIAATPESSAAFDIPSSSQESTTSTLSTDSMPKRNPAKRTLTPSDERDNDDEDLLPQITHTARAIAQPTSRRRRSPRLAQRQASFQTSLSFNYVPPPESVPAAGDFEEAEFFKAEEWRDEMDVENW